MSARVELVAKTLFHRTFGSEAVWDSFPTLAQDGFRDDARAVLDAIDRADRNMQPAFPFSEQGGL